MSSNIESMTLYRWLIDDCDASIAYWEKQPDLPERTENIVNYTDLKVLHEKNLQRLVEQEKAKGGDVIEGIKLYIQRLERLIADFGSWLPPEVKSWLTKLINAAKKLLEIFK